MLERQATGSLVSAKDWHLVSDYQLTYKCHFLSQIVALCVTQMRQKSVFPTGTYGNDLVFVGGEGAIAWTILPFILRRQWQHWWAEGNEMEYLPSLSAIFDIQSWKRQMVTMCAYRTAGTPIEKVSLPYRLRGSVWVLNTDTHPSQFGDSIFTPRGYISIECQFLSVNSKIPIVTLLVNIYLAVSNM